MHPDNSASSQQTPTILGVLLLTLLFWEWLRPLPILTETDSITPFMLFFACILLINGLRTPRWAKLPLGVLFLALLIHSYFFTTSFFSLDWLHVIWKQVIHSMILLFEWDFDHHSSVIKTISFMLVIWIAASYLYSSVIRRGNGISFLITTVVLLAVLDTFSPYQSAMPIVRTLIFGFGLLTLIHISKVMREIRGGERGESSAFPYGWVVISFVAVAVLSYTAYLIPKAGPSWPDPVRFLQGYHQSLQSGEGVGIQRVGYSSTDERLGGPFVQDEQIVFLAETEQQHYWRGESKDTYTGKGWIQSEQDELLLIADEQGVFSLEFQLYEGVNVEKIQTYVHYVNKYSHAFIPGDPAQIEFFPNSEHSKVQLESGLVQAWRDDGPIALDGYNISSYHPTFSTKALLEADLTSANSPIPLQLRNRYTQLPDSLPERVIKLAQEVVEGAETDYEKVKRVERFFRNNGYEYDTENVAYPSEDQDYVDQFLFETMIGYCDNFSTAMVVMLRAVNIPARWVKGFTFGEIIESEDDQQLIQTRVRNRNAHSWVEVYFPKIGWVPFEPTISFGNPYTFERDDLVSDTDQENTPNLDHLEHEMDDSFIDLEEFLFEHDEYWSGGDEPTSSPWMKVVVALGLLMLSVLGFIIIFRRQLILAWALVKYKETNIHNLIVIYEWLIQYFGRFVRKRKPYETLREYVLTLEETAQSEEWVDFTRYYEELRYHDQAKKRNVERAHGIWKRLMKKLQSQRR